MRIKYLLLFLSICLLGSLPLCRKCFSEESNIFEKAEELDSSGNYAAALEEMDKVITANPNDGQAYFNRGLISIKTKNYDAAIADFSKSIAIDDFFLVRFYRAKAYSEKGLSDKEIEDYTAGLKQKNSWREAIADKKDVGAEVIKSLQVDDEEIKAHFFRGQAYADKGLFDKAINDYSKCISLNPNYEKIYAVYIARGLTFAQEGKYPQALQDINKSMELNKADSKQGLLTRALVYMHMGEYDKALEDSYAVAPEETEDDSLKNIYLIRATSYLHKGNFEKSRENVLKGQRHGLEFDDGFLENLNNKKIPKKESPSPIVSIVNRLKTIAPVAGAALVLFLLALLGLNSFVLKQKEKQLTRFSFIDLLRCLTALMLFAIALPLAMYLVGGWVEGYSAGWSDKNILGYLTINNLFVFFAMDFLVTFLLLFTVRKKYRLIGGVFFLYALFALLILNLDTKNLITFLNGVVQLSAGATGGILAIYLHLKGKEKTQKETKSGIDVELNSLLALQANNANKKSPVLPKFLLGLSLISVPTTYIVLIISSFIVAGWSIWGLVLVMELPRIPTFILLGLIVAPFVSTGIALKALWATFYSKPHFEPAVILSDWKTLPIKSLIEEVCQKIKTKLPDNILLHAQPTFFVTNAKANTFDGIVKGRTLAIGVPLFKELSEQELKAVLAHEFAHFSGNDTLYSVFVSPVYKSLGTAVNELSDFGKNENSAAVNLAKILLLLPLLFVSVFAQYFALIDSILSRNRELRADWFAAKLYGTNSITTALLKVHEISTHFSQKSDDLALTEKEKFFESYSATIQGSATELEQYRKMSLAEENGDFDSHPTLGTRIVEMPYVAINSNGGSAATLLQEMVSHETRLSQLYTDRMRSIKEFYEKLQKIYENTRYNIQINNVKKLQNNKRFIETVASFSGEEPSKIEQLCDRNFLKFNGLRESEASKLIEIIKPFTNELTAERVSVEATGAEKEMEKAMPKGEVIQEKDNCFRVCSKCNEKNNPRFVNCWKCGESL